MSSFAEYSQYDALGLAELIKKGDISSTEVLEAAISATQRVNPSLNAIIHTCFDRARRSASEGLPQGPFSGVPFLLKDLQCAYQGEPLRSGSRGINWVPDFNSELANRYQAAGLNIMGKTNTPEYGLIITTEPKSFGPTHNPHKQGYSTGGSSGGSAAAVAAGIVPIAHGGDGGGSIRLPAAWCSLFGMKPSRGRTPMGPTRGEDWHGAVAEHAISRTVRDSAALLDATCAPSAGAPFVCSPPSQSFLSATQQPPKSLRIAVDPKPMVPGPVDPAVVAALEKTVTMLEERGHKVEYAAPAIDREQLWRAFFTIITAHCAAIETEVKTQFGKAAAKSLEPQTRNLAMLGRSMSGGDYVMAAYEWERIRMSTGQFLQQYDALLTPTTPNLPPQHGVLPTSGFEEWLLQASSHLNIGKLAWKLGMVEKIARPVLEVTGFTLLGNITGLPSMSCPLHWSQQGLPIGMLFTGRMGDERTLFNLAASLESEFQLSAPSSSNTTD